MIRGQGASDLKSSQVLQARGEAFAFACRVVGPHHLPGIGPGPSRGLLDSSREAR